MELGPGGTELLEDGGQEDEETRALNKRKYLALSKRCKEIEQVSEHGIISFILLSLQLSIVFLAIILSITFLNN